MVALVAAASFCKPTAGSGPECTVEWAADTAAGRYLRSHQALLEQGIPSSAFQSCLRATDSPVTFSTGGGPQPGVQTLSMNCNNMPEANHYSLKSCAVVRSTGLDVESGKAFVWIPRSLPFFVSDASKLRITCPEELKHYAVRVEEHVPIFESKVRFSRGLAATVSGGPPSHSSGGPFVVGVAAGSSDGPAAPAPPEDPGPVAPAVEDRLVPEGEAPRVSAHVQARRDEAVSKKHHSCFISRRILSVTPAIEPSCLPDAFVVNHGQIMSLMNMLRSVLGKLLLPTTSRSMCIVLLIRLALLPVSMLCYAFGISSLVCSQLIPALMALQTVVVALRKFVGKKVTSKTVSLLSDAAETFEAAAMELGWIHCPSLPNRFPHNSQMEREICSFEGGVRSVFLNAGFLIRRQLWPAGCKYGAMALNLTYSAPQDKELTRCDFAVAHLSYDDIPPIKCVLGQLVFYRSKIGDKFAPNAAPGLFAGWRLEPGCAYKGVGLVLDLAKLKNRTGAWTGPIPVPEQEIYVKDEAPGFPLKDASEIALSRLGLDEVVMPDPLPLPCSTPMSSARRRGEFASPMQDFSSLVRLLDAQPVRMIVQITVLNALLVLKLGMVEKEKLLLPQRFVAFLLHHRCHFPPSKRIVQGVLKLVLTWTLLRKQEVNMNFHQLGIVIHIPTPSKEPMTSRQWQSSLAQMTRMLHLRSRLLCIGVSFLALSFCMSSHAIPTPC